VSLKVSLDRESAAPGESVAGRVVASERVEASGVEVTLAFTETVGFDFTTAVRELPLGRIHAGDLEPNVPYAFTLQVPDDALPSARLHLATLEWRVQARVDRRGKDLRDWAELQVKPRRGGAARPDP
jgi:hypothetical protein